LGTALLLQALLRMLHALGTYPDGLQRPFLEQSKRYYQQEGLRLMESLIVPDYLAHCEARLAAEYERCAVYLDAATRKPLIAVVEAQLVAEHMPMIMQRGFGPLMDGHRVDDVSRLYTLAQRVGSLDALRTTFRDYIRSSGVRLVKDEEKDKEMVERLLELKARLDEVLQRALQRSEPFSNSLKEAFESFINQRQSKPAELIAKFIDSQLRAGNKGQAEDALEGMLDKVLVLFRYIQVRMGVGGVGGRLR
jgi:cullin-4